MNSNVRIICPKTNKVIDEIKATRDFNYSWKKDMKTMFGPKPSAIDDLYDKDADEELINRFLKDAGVKYDI